MTTRVVRKDMFAAGWERAVAFAEKAMAEFGVIAGRGSD